MADRIHKNEDVLLSLDAPAFVRRAQQLECAWEVLQEVCRRDRERLLEMPRMRLGRFYVLKGSLGSSLSPNCSVEGLAYLDQLYQEWKPRLRSAVKPARSEADVGQAVAELARSFLRFNRRWADYLDNLDLRPINFLREQYNRFYVLEKECALRSARLAREEFVPLAPVRIEDLLQVYPLLRVPTSPATD